MSKYNDKDMVAAGFHRLDKKLISDLPPKISWGRIYSVWPEDRKIEYLEKLAAAMNHAAHLIQGERNQLGELCEKKEAQIQSMKRGLDANNQMIQIEITKMNAERQQYNKAIADLNAKVRDGDHD